MRVIPSHKVVGKSKLSLFLFKFSADVTHVALNYALLLFLRRLLSHRQLGTFTCMRPLQKYFLDKGLSYGADLSQTPQRSHCEPKTRPDSLGVAWYAFHIAERPYLASNSAQSSLKSSWLPFSCILGLQKDLTEWRLGAFNSQCTSSGNQSVPQCTWQVFRHLSRTSKHVCRI